jgi:hypothetical protein
VISTNQLFRRLKFHVSKNQNDFTKTSFLPKTHEIIFLPTGFWQKQ